LVGTRRRCLRRHRRQPLSRLVRLPRQSLRSFREGGLMHGIFPILAATAATPMRLSAWSLAPLAIGLGLAILLALLGKVPVTYNLRNLQIRWRTTLVTALAFTLVIALLTVMLAFVNGMYKLTQGSGQPGNVIVLAQGSTDESFSNVPISSAGDIELLPEVLRDDQDRPVASRETYVVVNQPVQVRQPG